MLQGMRVIDCGTYISAPAAATIMADFGAEVIKVEQPFTGDPYRNEHPSLMALTTVRGSDQDGGAAAKDRISSNWVIDGRSKKSIGLNLNSPEGKKVLRDLVKTADVFITNFPLDVRARLSITQEEIRALNPRLIYASFTGFGEVGPEALNRGFDATVWWARSGLMELVRTGSNAPTRLPPGLGDHNCSVSLFASIVLALLRREQTGEGGHVGTSLLMNGYWSNALAVQATFCGEPVSRQPDRKESRIPLRNAYRCSDDRWLILSIIQDQRRWELLREALQSDLLHDPLFVDPASRAENAPQVTAVLDRVFATRTLKEWTERLRPFDVTFGPVVEMHEVAEDEQAKANGVFVPFAESDLMTVTSPFWVDGFEKPDPKPAPRVGEHTDEILSGLGYSAEEKEALKGKKIIS